MHDSTLATTTGAAAATMIQPYRINNCKFQQSMIRFLRDLHDSKAYTDVVLHAEGKLLNAHRVVLAAGSGYFKSLFSTLPQSPNQSLVVALPNVKYKDLEQVVKFIYHGYVDIVDSQLNVFVSLAKELRVVGMINDDEEDGDEQQQQQEPNGEVVDEVKQTNDASSSGGVATPATRPPQLQQQQQQQMYVVKEQLVDHHGPSNGEEEDDDDGDDGDEDMGDDPPPLQNQVLIQSFAEESNELEFDEDFDDDEFEQQQQQTVLAERNKVTRGSSSIMGTGATSSNPSTTPSDMKPFVCLKCGKTYNSNKSLWRHKKFTCDEKIEFTCELCGKVFSRSDNLRRHVVVAHHQN